LHPSYAFTSECHHERPVGMVIAPSQRVVATSR
jgi:hypothetical protein